MMGAEIGGLLVLVFRNYRNMQNMNPVIKYALIGILGIVVIVVAIEIYKQIFPPKAQEMDKLNREFLEEVCRIKPSDKRCEKLK